MDHKWGRNVTTYGLGDIGATVCSRLPGPGVLVVITNAHRFVNTYEIAQVPVDTLNQYAFLTFTIPPLHPHFPYGWPVEPDVPL